LSATHGFVLLAMSGFIDSHGLLDVMAPMAINLVVGLGDTRRRAERSLTAAIKARASQHKTNHATGSVTRAGISPEDSAIERGSHQKDAHTGL
jgi:hypothetical protein